jgi:hypothetical protein
VEHGHALLLRALEERRPEWVARPGIRMLEVGTTREPLPSQDSTRILSQFCLDHGWDFVTCDMDPVNSERARELFASMGASFTAVTDKGEDYIRTQKRRFDVVYLDAYDFDHGKHSEERQERYQAFLGERIDQTACEIMHLEAMKGLNHAGSRNCLVVLDDTWREKGKGPWLGKGPRAVPWALNHGWSITMDLPDYRAVVLELDPRYYRFDQRVVRAVRRAVSKLHRS